MADAEDLYAFLGGEEGVQRLTDAFYRRVAKDPVLQSLFAKNLRHESQILARFVTELCGGPPEYTERHGHPLMRARHQHVKIGEAEREAWVAAMAAALDEVEVLEPARTLLRRFFERAAGDLVNAGSAADGATHPRRRPVLRRLNPLRSRHR
ncbi:MAG TPA: globin [Chloroflexota bacterium]|nr:globin [Chloroflexota bacterium]